MIVYVYRRGRVCVVGGGVERDNEECNMKIGEECLGEGRREYYRYWGIRMREVNGFFFVLYKGYFSS